MTKQELIKRYQDILKANISFLKVHLGEPYFKEREEQLKIEIEYLKKIIEDLEKLD